MMENNFKRFLSLLLAFVMVFGMFPANVFATGGDTTDVIVENQGEILTDDTGDDVASSEEEEIAPIADVKVAKVGNTEYATIDEAIAAWTNGTTLTLLADVTLSDVVKLKSTEHHTLDLGTYTMTAASGKNAIVIQACGNGSAERTAITINADATNPGGINAGSKSVVYYKYADGGISTEDRPIIKINGGVFTGSTSSWGTAGIYTIGTAARKCATLNITGGTFNCTINGSGKSKLIVSGGTFNYSVGSQGDSTALRLISGGKFKTLGFMTADSNNTKFWFGTSMGNSNVGLYVDNEGYLVVGGPVITEVSAQYPAVASNATKWSSYLAYSAAATYGLFYTDPNMAIKKHGEANVATWEFSMTIPENVEGDEDVIEEIKNNSVLDDYTPENLPEKTELEVKLVSADEVIVYDVAPMANAVKVSKVETPITFRLPVPASVTETQAKVYHDGKLMGVFEIVDEGNGKFVEISSAEFSEFKVEPVTVAAMIGEQDYQTLEDAFANAVEGDTITLLDDATPALTSQRAITKASVIDLNGKTLTLAEDDLYFGTTTFQNGKIVVDPSVFANTAVFWMFENQTLVFENVEITATGVTGTYLIGINGGSNTAVKLIGSKIIINNTDKTGLGTVICDNGNGNSVVIESCDIDVSNIDGRFYLGGTNGTVTVKDSDVDLDGVKEGFYIRAGQTLSIKGDSNVAITLNETTDRYGINVTAASATYEKAETATVTATVYEPPFAKNEATKTATIKNLDGLKKFRDEVNDGNTFAGWTVVLAANIDLANEEWAPIGYMGKTFKGTFDGGNFTISNLKITKELTNTTANNGIGFFGRTDDTAVIKNLTIENVDITGSLHVGAVVGLGYTGKLVENVTVKGDIAIDAWWYAGVIGGNGYMNLINDCHVIGNEGSYIKGNAGSYIGGIWGFRGEGNNKITNCSVKGLEILGVDRVGGICGIGHYGNSISGCVAEDVTVTATDPDATTVGLIVGACEGTASEPTKFENNTLTNTTAQIANGDGTYTKVENEYGSNINGGEAVTNYAVKIGNKTYLTLDAAVAAAKAGDEIVLLADVTEDVILPAGVIFNGNGKTVNGTITAGGDLTIKGYTKVTSFSASYYNRTITIGKGACLEVTGTGRVTLGYGNTFNIVGSIENAKTVDKTAVQPSLVIPGGISITGGNDAAMNVTNAYVKIGSTSSKNSAANGKFVLNFTNSIAEFTNQLTLSEPTSGKNPTFELNVKDSILTTSTKLCIAASNTTAVIDNSVVTLGSYLRNSGELTLVNGSVLTGSMIQFGENGGNDGTITVDASTLTINNSSAGHAMDGNGTGKLIVKNSGTADVDYITESAVHVAIDSSLTSKSGDLEVTTDEGYDVAYNETTGKYEFTKAPVAKIGEQKFQTLEAAFKAATEGCTIEILQNVTIDYKWDCRDYATNGSHSQFKESVTINGNGKTIKFTGTVNDNNWNTIFRFEENATVNNLTIDISEATGAQRVISAKKSLSVDGLTIIGSAKYGIIFGEGASDAELATAEIEVKNSTLTGTRRAISDNEGGKDVKSVTVTDNTLNANVYVSASEKVVFSGNTANGEVDIRSYSADNVLSVEAKGNTLTEGVKNYIYAKSIDAQDEFATENPPIKVSTKAELNTALAAAKEGDTIVLTADIDYGTDQLAITKAITLDLGGKTLTTRNAFGGMSVKGNPTIKNGNIVHASNTAAIKVWNATAFEVLVIDVQGKGDATKTIGGIVLQEGSTTRVGSIKNVTIKGEALTNGIETYNCGNATQNVIGSMENVTIDALGTGLLISAPCGTATNCNISGDKNAIELWIKGTYSASLTLDDSKVEGTVSVHDENASNVTNNGTLSLIVDEETTGVSEETVTLTINHAKEDRVKGEVLENIIATAQAKVNGTYYATVAEAMAAVTDGATVTIMAGTYDYALVLNPKWNNVTVIGEGNVTMNGVPSIKGTGYKVENIDFVYGTGSTNLSGTGLIKDCSFTATNASGNTFRYCYGVKNGAITFEGCKLNAPAWAVHFDGASGTNLTFTDCEIKGRVALAGDLGSLTATGTTFENGYVNIWGTDDAAAFTGCDFVNVPYIFTGRDADNVVKFAECKVNGNADGKITDLIHGGVDKANALIYVDEVLQTGVVAIGENRYATLSEAVNAAQAGETIVLLKNVSEEIQIPDGAKLTLNLNGKTLNGCIKPFKGNLTVENGSIVNTNKSVSGIEITAGELVLNNVNITSARHAVRVEGAATVTIDGGVYKVDPTAKGTYHAVNVGGAGGEKVTIKGGTFIGPKGTMADSGAAVNIRANAEVTIEGGSFSGGKLGTLSNAGKLTVTGGTFDQNPVDYIPEGYVSEKQEDGSYKVRQLKDLVIHVGPVTTRAIVDVSVATMDDAVAYAQANPADSVTYKISGPVELTTGGSHGILNLGKNVTIEGVTPDAKLTIVGGGVPDIKGVTFKNITLADEGTYLPTANEFMYQNYIDCSFENVTFVDGIRLSGKSTLTGCTVNVNTTNEYAIWLDEGEFTMTGSTVTGGNDAYGLIKSDEVDKITITGNTFEYLGNANKEALNVKGAVIDAEDNTFIDCVKGILPADKTNYAEDGTTVLTDTAVVGDNKVIINVAQIGEQKFETLDAAYAAAQNGNEVVILKAGSYKLPTGKNITITGKVDGIVFDNIGAHGMGGANVTFNNVTFDYYPNVNYTGLQHSGNLEYNNCTINGQVFLYGQSETFNNCTFNQNSADAYNVWTYGAKKVEFNNCTFNSVGKSVLVYAESAGITNAISVTNSTFNASAPVDGKAAIEIDTSLTGGATITIDAATTATGFSNGNVSGNSLWNNKKGNNTDANNDVTVKVGDETVLAPVTFAAYIGKTGYTTIAAAIAAAQAGETVVLNADVTLTESLVIGKAVILNLNGKTITGTDNATSSFGLINIQPGAALTINDTVGTGKITLTATNNRGWGAYSSVISNQRGTLTVNGGTIEHLGGTDMAYGIDNLTNGKGTRAETVINGGTIKSTYRAIRQFLNGTEAQNILTINGGTIEGANKSVWMQDANKSANPGKLTIGADATIKGNVYVTASAGSTVWPVELSIADAALKDGATVLTSNIPATYVVEKNNGVWGVSNGLKGSGTEADPYQIGTLSELILFRDSVNAGETKYNAPGVVVALTADIDMAGTDWSVNIGDDCNATFDGIFDGRNYSIKNLTSVETAAKADGYVCSGLFGAIYGDAVVKNLTIENVNINTGDFVGNNVAAVVGFAYTATGSIENVTVTGDIKINAQEITGVGAIVGYVYMGDLDVKNCSVKGNDGSAITGAAYVGSIVGCGDGKMTVSDASVENVAIKATSCCAAGIAGIMLEGGEVNGATVKNVTVTSAHANWQNAAAIAVGTITGTITVSDVTAENVNVTAMVGAVHANKPTTPVAKVAAKIGNKYYTTFAAAYAAANEGETVTLLAPIVVAAGETLELNKAVTVTYTSNVPGEDMITNRGNLVIDGTTLVYTNTDTTASNVTVSTISTEAGSTLEVKSGTVKNESANNGSKGIYAFAIDLLTNGGLGDVTATISGGEIISTNYMAIRQFNNGTACKNTLTVTDGKIYGAARAIQIHLNNDAAYTTISGGTVEAGEGGYALCFFPANATHIAVKGGTFTGAVYSATNGFITGGTYSEELYEAYCAEGYATTKNADGTYGVIEQTTVTITVGNATMVAGNSLPEFTYTSDVEIEGLTVEFSTADGKTAGVYDINATVTAPTDSKYVYEIVPGKLTVEAALIRAYAANNAKVKYFTNLNDALQYAASTNDYVPVTILGNITVSETIVFNDSKPNTIELQSGKTGGNTYTITVDTDEPFLKMEAGRLNMKNLRINAKGDAFYVTGGELNLNCHSLGKQFIEVTSQTGNCVYIRGGSVNVNGAKLTSLGAYPAIQGNGNYTGNVTINTWNIGDKPAPEISAPNAGIAIYWPGNGKLAVEAGTITGKTALYAKSGTINISGGTFTATGDKVDFKHYSNGAYATGDAVVIEACKDAAYETPVVTITGGTFTSANADAVKFYSCDTTAAAANVMDISGGSYSTPVAEEYCAEGYIPTKQAPYTVKLGKFVARVNGVGYETIAEAIDAAVAGETVVLVAETEETEVIIDKAIMLDVNGINLTASVTLADLGATVKAAEDQTVVSGVKDYKVKYENGTHKLVKAVIAMIGQVGYSSLQEAVDAAKAGATITLVCDAEGPGVVIDKKLTIDFRNFTYTLTEGVGSTGTESNGFQILKGTTVILRNGTLKVADDAASKFYILIQNYSDSLTLNNMVLDGRNLDKWAKTDGDSYVLSNNSGKVTVNSQTKFIVNNDGNKAMAFDVCDKTAWGYALPTITVSAAKAIYVDEATLATNYKQYIEAAAIISNTYYATLQQAVDKGGTVNLFRSMEGPGVVIRNDVNINFGGFTYSVNEPVGSKGTESNGFQILDGNTVVLRNGKLEVAASAADKFYILVQNHSDSLSMTGIILDGTNLDKWSKTDGDSYTLSNNNGTVSIGANTTIIANNDGALAFAFDACDKSAWGYELPVVTVHKTAVIEGNIEAAAKIGNVYYATLQAALDAAKSNQTVTLVSDIKVDAADAVKNSNGLTVMFNIEGKSLTLDMAGKTIDVAYDSSELMYAVVCVADGASLTVKGEGKIDLTTGDTKAGSYDCVAYMFLKTGNTGVLNIENGTFTANKVEDSMVYTTGDKVVSVKGGNWTLENVGTDSNKSPWIFNSKGNGENSILVSGGTYNYNVGLQHWAHEVDIVDANGNLSYVVDNGNGTWTVTGKTAEVCIMVDVAGDYDYPVGYATFKDAVASIAKGAAETTIVLQKDITVKGQFIGHSYAQKVVIDLNGYTMSSTDKTLTVYRGGTEVTIKNGTVYGNTTGGTIQVTYGGKLTLGENVTVKSGGQATAIKVDANATLIIDQDTTYVLGGKNDLVVADGATVQISAGYFKKPVQDAWCAEGYVPTDKLENGYYSVMEDPSIGMEAKIGDTYFKSLQAAIEAAQTGDVIVVVNDITVDTTAAVMNSGEYATIYNVAEKAITIDLNGKKIDVTANAADLAGTKNSMLLGVFCVDTNGSLTLTGNGTVTANAVDASMTSDDSHLYSLMTTYGKDSELFVENGTFHANSVSSALVYSQYDESITINGGTYTLGNLGTDANGSPWIFNAKGQNTQNILVNGGTFSADIVHQYYPFEVQMPKELALKKVDGMYTTVPAVAYVNEQEWSSKWYTNYVGYATVEEAVAAAKGVKTKVVGKNTYYSECEVVTILNKGETVEIESNDVAALDTALLNGGNVTMTENMTVSANDTTANSGYGATGVKVNGGTFNGNGNTLNVPDANGLWDCAVNVTSGVIQNVTVTGAFRGIFMGGANGDVYINNVTVKDVVYTFNSDGGNKDYGVYISNSTLNGWTSFSDVHKEVVFTDCTFGEGSGYAYCRPYNASVFENCVFEVGFEFDTTENSNIVFKNCYYGDTLITAENAATLGNGETTFFCYGLNGAVIK